MNLTEARQILKNNGFELDKPEFGIFKFEWNTLDDTFLTCKEKTLQKHEKALKSLYWPDLFKVWGKISNDKNELNNIKKEYIRAENIERKRDTSWNRVGTRFIIHEVEWLKLPNGKVAVWRM